MAENDDSSSDTSTDSEEFGVGSKCRAPFSRFSNSSINLTYHNALIFELDSERNIDLTESKVRNNYKRQKFSRKRQIKINFLFRCCYERELF